MDNLGVIQTASTQSTCGVACSSSGAPCVTRHSCAVAKMFGHSHRDLVGQNVSLLIPEPFGSQHQAYLDRYLETGQQVRARCVCGAAACVLTGGAADGHGPHKGAVWQAPTRARLPHVHVRSTGRGGFHRRNAARAQQPALHHLCVVDDARAGRLGGVACNDGGAAAGPSLHSPPLPPSPSHPLHVPPSPAAQIEGQDIDTAEVELQRYIARPVLDKSVSLAIEQNTVVKQKVWRAGVLAVHALRPADLCSCLRRRRWTLAT